MGLAGGGLRNLQGIGEYLPGVQLKWPFSEGTGDTVDEVVGTYSSQEGNANFSSWDDSIAWYRQYAMAGDGSDDIILTGDWGDWASNNLLGTHTVAFTIRTTDTDGDIIGHNYSASDNAVAWGIGNTTTHTGSSASGELFFTIRDDGLSNNINMWSDGNTYDDGNPHRVVWVSRGTDKNDVELWVDDTEISLTNSGDSTVDKPNFERPVGLLATNGDGSTRDHINADIDNVTVASTDWSEGSINEDYTDQPWV